MHASASSQDAGLTAAVVQFVQDLRFESIPDDAIALARRCVLDGLAVTLAAADEPAVRIVTQLVDETGGSAQARVVGQPTLRVPPAHAALCNGVAGHAMDWDDTQLTDDSERVFGLLTHPTIPPLAAGLAVADSLGGVDGRRFLTAFLAGFEVECKLAEAISPSHYLNGFHSSGTMGTLGAAVCSAKLMRLDTSQVARTIGIAASMASGIRVNFGTMTKPLHVGRAAENGVTAAKLAAAGYGANEQALDGRAGYFAAAGGGVDPDRLLGRLGQPFSIVKPGVSVKPYPCGSLTHPTLDAMRALVTTHSLSPADIETVTLYAGKNILDPIRYGVTQDELEAKFSMPFLLAAMIVAGRVGKAEFAPDFLTSRELQQMQQRVATKRDIEIEAQGFDRMRSRIEVRLHDGRTVVKNADPNYRGGPDNPLSDAELDGKLRDCAQGQLDDMSVNELSDFVRSLEQQSDVAGIFDILARETTLETVT